MTAQQDAGQDAGADSVATRTMRGIGLTALGYALFAIQDATVKWLVVQYAVPQILFTRSLIIVAFAAMIGGRHNLVALARSREKTALMVRAAIVLVAWLSYYSSARYLQLAQLTTLYFAAPIIVVVLSVFILHERVALSRWLAVLLGFVGVVLAADPGGSVTPGPALLAVFAACGWALSVILARLIARSVTTAHQMLVSNTVFALACAVMLIWTWRTPDLFSLGLMLGIGVAGGLGQVCLYEGFRFAPASVIAPIEYTGLVWAFLYGYLVFADVPPGHVFAGAGLIAIASLSLIWFERRRQQRGVAAEIEAR